VATSRPFKRRQQKALSPYPVDIVTDAKAEKTELTLEEQNEQRIARSRVLALRAAEAGMEKKAAGVEIIDVAGKVDYADFLVLMTGTSSRHCAAIADSVDQGMSKHGDHPISQEGKGSWVLLDFFDVVVHVFSDEARELYDLSGLWMDAGRVPVPDRTNGASGN